MTTYACLGVNPMPGHPCWPYRDALHAAEHAAAAGLIARDQIPQAHDAIAAHAARTPARWTFGAIGRLTPRGELVAGVLAVAVLGGLLLGVASRR